MLFFFIGAVAIVLGLCVAIFSNNNKMQGVAAFVVGLILLIVSLFTSVPTGYTGILTTFGKVNDSALEAGINIKMPWQDVVLMDNREQTKDFSVLAFSSDIQEVKVSGTISYSINKTTAMKLYRDIGKNYYDILVTPRLNEAIKVTISEYTAEKLIINRGQLSANVLEVINAATSEYGLNIINVAIDVDFSDSFTDAVEAKQVATQVLQKAQTEQEQETMIAQQQAERQKIEAQAEADVAKMQADAEAYAIRIKAEAEAEANKKLAESLTDELIDYQQAILWNGVLPATYISGTSDALPVVGIN